LAFPKDLTVAVASGKGGTGKTTVSTSLALAAAGAGLKVTYADCDVEEPNGHLFLKPEISRSWPVGIPVPAVDEEKCTLCGICGEVCQYKAIACLGSTVLTFDKMCHGCGGCALACPVSAISEKTREIGVVEEGRAGAVSFLHGRTNVGEPMSPPLIRAVRGAAEEKKGLVVVDAPPGTTCPVVASVRGADFVLLVTEPTPFGVNDLELAVDMMRKLEIPHAVLINKARPGRTLAAEYCRREGVEVLGEIPDDRLVAEVLSRGELPLEQVPGYSDRIKELLIYLLKEARK